MEAGPFLGHQRQVGRVGIVRFDEVIGRLGGAKLVELDIEDLDVLGRIGAHFGFAEMRSTFIAQRADRHIFQPVAGRADLGIDLEAALKLKLVIGAERTLEGEVHVLDFLVAAARGMGRTRKGEGAGC